MNIDTLRQSINEADDRLLQAFLARMKAAQAIGEYKAANGLPLSDPEREHAVLERQAAKAGPDMRKYVEQLYNTLFDISKSFQERITGIDEQRR